MKRNLLLALLAAGLGGSLAAQDAQPTAPPATGGGERQRGERPERGERGERGDRQNFQRGGFGGPGGGIGLDEKQRELYREASEKNREALTQLDEKLRSLQQELVKAVLAENYDDKLVREKADAVAKIQSDMTVLRAKALSTVAPTLKPEQREQLETSRFGAMMLTSGGMGGIGGNNFSGPGGFGGPGGDAGRGFRGRDGQSAPPGSEQGPNDRGNRPPGERRRPQPPQ